MLQRGNEQVASVNDDSGAGAGEIDIRWMIDAVLQRRWFIIAVPTILMALAAIFVVMRPATYLASTQLQLTNLRLTFSREDAFFVETQPDPAFLETQLQVIRSDRVALSALTTLGLLNPQSTVQKRVEALEALRRVYGVDRAGQSNVVQIYYEAKDPALAARVANGIATAYMAELQASRSDSAQSGSSWLREKLREVGPKARVIAEALPPPHKSNVRGILIIAAAGLVGACLAAFVALMWRLLDGRVRSPEDAAAITGVRCLGQFPQLPAAPARPKSGPIGNTFRADCPVQTFVIDAPGSNAWHTIRTAIGACQAGFGGQGVRFIGVTSTFAGEGRSTIATNLALALAVANHRVLLVDADAFDPALSAFYGGERAGLTNYLAEDKSLDRFTMVERRTGLHFLPLGADRGAHPANIWTDGIRRFLDEAATAYDYVIFDLPTLGMNADLRSAARYIDGFFLVVGWEQVSSQDIQVGLKSLAPVQERLLGTVLNKVDAAEAKWTLSAQTAFASRQNRTKTSSPTRTIAIAPAAKATKQGKKWTNKVLQLAFPRPTPVPPIRVLLEAHGGKRADETPPPKTAEKSGR